MKEKRITNAALMEYANAWVEWYESDRKQTAELFKKTLLKMDAKKLFDLNEYNRLVDHSNERDETRIDAKKMARVLANSWVWSANAEELNKFNHRVNSYKKDMSSRAGERLVRASKNDGVKF